MLNSLKKHLTLFDLIVIGVAGAVGTGVLFSSAGMAAVAGPGVVLAWLIGAVMYLFVGLTYVDLSYLYPEAGGPSRYSLYSYGKTTNMINAFADLIWYLFIPPVEALATVEGLNYFYPHFINALGNPTTAGAVLGVVLMLLFLPFNYYGVRMFANSTNVFGIAKLLLYVVVGIGFLSFAHSQNFTAYGGFMPFGMGGVFAAIPLGMFAFGGIRVIPDYAEEVKQPRLLGHAILWSVLGQTIIYVLLSLGFLTALDWSQLKIHPGTWSAIASIAGNPFLTIAQGAHVGWLIFLTVIIAVIGPFVTGYIYQGAGSRILLAMGRSGLVSAKMQELSDRYAIPVWALLVFTVIGAVVAYIAAPLPSIYSLITDAVVAGYLGFAVNPVVMLALRKEGHAGKLKNGSLVAVLAFASASLIVYWSGWPSVPYATVLLALASVVFGLMYKVKGGFVNAIWYIAYVLFLTLMTYIGSVGALKWFNIDIGSVIVVVVCLVLFLPWGIASRMAPQANPDVTAKGSVGDSA
ncbi:APC family permease [Sulfobacillus sp. hq2]|uniref:APC family permease n=1 Tax=Sulfobacillus TaxID=28033 RepID=UPI001FA875FA|nr:APC family permease [Sulfobacillus sp. hq2]